MDGLLLRRRRWLGWAAWVLLACRGASGAALYVDAGSSAPQWPYEAWATAARTIQEAVDAASGGDVVWVTNGTYSSGGRVVPGHGISNRVAIMKAVSVQSVNGAAVTTITGANPAGDQAVRCAYLTNGAALTGFTLKGGATRTNGGAWSEDQSGGGALLAGGILNACVLASNEAVYGGGVFSAGGLVTNCILSWNRAVAFPASGGGAYCVYGGKIKESFVKGNTGSYGGGVFCDVEGAVQHCVLTNNFAGQNGGAVFCAASTVVVRCRQAGNYAARQGGGAYLWKGGALRDSVLAGNESVEGGGACFAGGGTVEGCTVVQNVAVMGGGVCAYSGGEVWNSILYLNTAPTGANYQLAGAGARIAYTCMSPLVPDEGNTALSPQFVDASGGNYRLAADSPCIDAGTNQEWMFEVTDLWGQPRIWVDVADLGAYEFNPGGPDADTDADGLPDWWEWQFFAHVTSTVASADQDGDQYLAFQEYIAGTDPRDGTSLLWVDITPPSGQNVVLEWPSVNGRFYTLYRLTNLMNQSSAAVVLNHAAATPPINSYQEPFPAGNDRGTVAYKLKVEL